MNFAPQNQGPSALELESMIKLYATISSQCLKRCVGGDGGEDLTTEQSKCSENCTAKYLKSYNTIANAIQKYQQSKTQ